MEVSVSRSFPRSFVLAAVLLCMARSAIAVALGEVVSVSRAGGTLRVEIELGAADGQLPEQSSCFSLVADPPNPAGLPVLANGRATLRTLDGRHSVIVNSSQYLGERAILGLRLGCGSDARRDYVLSIPPPEVAPAPARIFESNNLAEAPASLPQGDAMAGDRPQSAPARPLRQRRPVLPRARGEVEDRLTVSLTEADEALSRRLARPASGPVDYRAAGDEAVALDSRLSDLEASIARLRAELDALPSPHPARAIVSQPAAGPSSRAPSAPADSALAVMPRQPPVPEYDGYSWPWLLAFGAGGALLALAGVALFRRWVGHGQAAVSTAPPTAASAAQSPLAERRSPAQASDAHAAPGHHTIEVVEPTSPLELAEFMLSFGRVDDAAMALEEYIANNPKGAIEPWRKLLAIYRQVGRRHAFEALARRMQKTFDVPLPSWERQPDR